MGSRGGTGFAHTTAPPSPPCRHPASSREFTTQEAHLQDASSQALCVTDPLLEGLGFSFTPAPPFTLPPGGHVTDTFDVKLKSEANCLWLDAQDGKADGYIHNTVTVKWEDGSARV